MADHPGHRSTAVRFLFFRRLAPARARECRRRGVFSLQARSVRAQQQRRFQYLACATDPASQGRALQFDAFALIDFRLPVQRKMIAILYCRMCADKSRSGQPPVYRPRRRRFLHDHVTSRARMLGSYNPNNFEVRRNVLEYLGNIFAQPLEHSAAIRANRFLIG